MKKTKRITKKQRKTNIAKNKEWKELVEKLSDLSLFDNLIKSSISTPLSSNNPFGKYFKNGVEKDEGQ